MESNNKAIETTTYNSPQFGALNTIVDESGEIWFMGKNVAQALGYVDTSQAIRKNVDSEDTTRVLVNLDVNRLVDASHQKATAKRTRKTQEAVFINESGLYSLVLSSKLPQAKAFKHWVTSEVLPSIRKTGRYSAVPEDSLTTVQTWFNAMKSMYTTIQQLEAEREANKPHTELGKAITSSVTSIPVGNFAKVLNQNGFKIGQNRLFKLLREEGFLCSSKSVKNVPTQRYMNSGLFEVEEKCFTDYATGDTHFSYTTKITGKGQEYLLNKFLNGAFKDYPPACTRRETPEIATVSKDLETLF